MKDKNNWLRNLFNNIVNQEGSSQKKKNPSLYLIILLALGVLVMVGDNLFGQSQSLSKAVSAPVTTEPNKPEAKETFGGAKGDPKTMGDYEGDYETRLKSVLDSMLGVKDVQVMVNLESSEKMIYERNVNTQTQNTEEIDKQGGKRTINQQTVNQQVVVTNKGNGEGPIVIQTEKPEISGVLVVANGVDDIQVKKNIIEAVTRVLGVPSFKVSIQLKKK